MGWGGVEVPLVVGSTELCAEVGGWGQLQNPSGFGWLVFSAE